jgi:RNA polymerase sigma-70 factor (ECF subfamily)
MNDLIRNIIRGDKEAFDLLVKEYSSLVTSTIYKVFYKYSFNAKKEDVEDLHNALFLSLMENEFKKLRQFKGISSLSSYIYVITTRFVVDFLRKQKKHVSIDCDETSLLVKDNGVLPDKAIELTEEEKTVKKIIKTLPPSDQLLLRLVFEKELSPNEVTKIMKISMVAYYNRKSRIMKRIKKMCEKLDPNTSKKYKG